MESIDLNCRSRSNWIKPKCRCTFISVQYKLTKLHYELRNVIIHYVLRAYGLALTIYSNSSTTQMNINRKQPTAVQHYLLIHSLKWTYKSLLTYSMI